MIEFPPDACVSKLDVLKQLAKNMFRRSILICTVTLDLKENTGRWLNCYYFYNSVWFHFELSQHQIFHYKIVVDTKINDSDNIVIYIQILKENKS